MFPVRNRVGWGFPGTGPGQRGKTWCENEPPDHHDYRDQAWHIRGVAEMIKDTEVRMQLLLIASLYDKLAEHVGSPSSVLSDIAT
jgi:hypothetical protein